MAIVVILVLGILWAAVLLPPILRARSEGGGSGFSAGVADFMSMFSSFGRGRTGDSDVPGVQPLMGPVGPMGPMGTMGNLPPASGMSPAQRRRRDVLVGLLIAAGITLVMALFSGGSALFLGIHLLVDVLLGGYLYLLLQFKSRQQERRTKVRPLQPAGRHLRPVPNYAESAPEPAFALRRTASY